MSESGVFQSRLAQIRPRILSALRKKYFAWFTFNVLLVAVVLIVAAARSSINTAAVGVAVGFVFGAGISTLLQFRAMTPEPKLPDPEKIKARQEPAHSGARRAIAICAVLIVAVAFAFAINPAIGAVIAGDALGTVFATLLVVTAFQRWFGDRGTNTVVSGYLMTHPEILLDASD